MSDTSTIMRLTGSFRKIGLASIACIGMGVAAELPSDTLEELADDQFQVREVAQLKLLQWARDNEGEAPRLLFGHHRSSKDPEVKIRCMDVLKELAKESYSKHGKGFIGIQMRDEMVIIPGNNEHRAAIRISVILPGMAAEKAGLKVGDLLVGINGKHWPAPATDAMKAQVMAMTPGTKITVQVLRDEKVEDVNVTLVKRPVTADDQMLQHMPGRAAEAEKRAWDEYFRMWKERHDPGA